MSHRLLPMGLYAVLVGSGALLCVGAVILAVLGMASAELLTGPLLVASGVQLWRGKRSALSLFFAYFLVVWGAGLWEVGLDGWALLPRVDFACAVLPLFFFAPIRRHLACDDLGWMRWRLPGLRWMAVAIPVAALMVLPFARLHSATSAPQPAARIAAPADQAQTDDWSAFGGASGATKFSALDEIDTGNAARLKVLWEHVEPARLATGVFPEQRKDEATPIKIRDKLFLCTSDNVVIALDAETGKLRWRYDPRVVETGVKSAICRGLAYSETAGTSDCPHRLLMGTLDARLIAIDADAGTPCPGFGQGGTVDLTRGVGPVRKGYYYQTSPPTVAKGVAVVGALVRDNQETGEPSGVVRGFDVRHGRLLWAFDMGARPAPAGGNAESASFTRGTPNAWTVFSADRALGLVYVPMGNATPDFVGQHRKAEWERYSSALVALDLRSGQVRWAFQTVHHDLWDNDLSAQPILATLPSPDGSGTPVVIIGTKRGQIFLLDRRDGHPASKVEERAVPQTDVPGEWTSPTQPVSADMPDIGGQTLRDADMWGISPFDRMYCRISLRRLRYEGPFTPPSLGGTLIYPGVAGGVDWGGLSYDPGRQLLLVPAMFLAQKIRLIKREAGAAEGNNPQRGTDYSAELAQFITRLGIPCQRPPFAQLTAINLASRQVVWQRPIGTAEALGPLGIASRLPLTIGAPPLIGGAISTAGDLVILGATGDRRLRVLDSRDGRELWSTRLPQGNQATPITYRTPRSRRQLVVMVSGSWADLGKSRAVPVHVLAYGIDP